MLRLGEFTYNSIFIFYFLILIFEFLIKFGEQSLPLIFYTKGHLFFTSSQKNET